MSFLPISKEEHALNTTAELKNFKEEFVGILDPRLFVKNRNPMTGPCDERPMYRCKWEGGGHITCRFVDGIKFCPSKIQFVPMEPIFECDFQLPGLFEQTLSSEPEEPQIEYWRPPKKIMKMAPATPIIAHLIRPQTHPC